MEDILNTLYKDIVEKENTLGIVEVEKKQKISPITDTFDKILFVIVNNLDNYPHIKQYQIDNEKIAMHFLSEEQVKWDILSSSNQKIIEWLYEGNIIYDKNAFLTNFRRELRDFPFNVRKIKMGIEFAKLIRRYLNGKAFYESGQLLDAYNHMVHCLHHLARLVIIENGFYPELTVWNQMKQMDPEIYKLYEELVSSEESLEKRLDLLFIASEFLIYSRTSSGAGHLLDIMELQPQWSMEEMKSHPELRYYGIDLEMLLEYLVDKDFIHIIVSDTDSPKVYERYYQKNN